MLSHKFHMRISHDYASMTMILEHVMWDLVHTPDACGDHRSELKFSLQVNLKLTGNGHKFLFQVCIWSSLVRSSQISQSHQPKHWGEVVYSSSNDLHRITRRNAEFLPAMET